MYFPVKQIFFSLKIFKRSRDTLPSPKRPLFQGVGILADSLRHFVIFLLQGRYINSVTSIVCFVEHKGDQQYLAFLTKLSLLNLKMLYILLPKKDMLNLLSHFRSREIVQG